MIGFLQPPDHAKVMYPTDQNSQLSSGLKLTIQNLILTYCQTKQMTGVNTKFLRGNLKHSLDLIFSG